MLLTFLVPAVIFGAIAGVYSDQFDRRWILVACNLLRGLSFVLLFFVDHNVLLLYVVVAIVATLTTFFGPAEASMIPRVVDREHLMSANGLFVFTLQASFVVGFAVLGPLFLRLLGIQLLIGVVAACYVIAAALCASSSHRRRRQNASATASPWPAARSRPRPASCARALATSGATAPSRGRWPTSRSPRR